MTDLQLRALHYPDDIPALVTLKNTYFEANNSERRVDEQGQKHFLSYPKHDPEKDNRLAEIDGDVVGYLWLWQQTAVRSVFDLVVHPAHDHSAIGSPLLQWAVERAREQGSQFVDAQRVIDDTEGISFLRAHGFKPLGTYMGMSLEPTVALPENKLPDGYSVKVYSEVKDIALYTDVMNRSYGDLWGHMSDVTEDVMAESFDEFKPNNIFLLFHGEAIVGVGRIVYDHSRTVYWVDAPGIVPAHRSADVYKALLVYCLHRLRAIMQKSTRIGLHSWGDFDSSVANFWQLGFDCNRHVIGYRYYL